MAAKLKPTDAPRMTDRAPTPAVGAPKPTFWSQLKPLLGERRRRIVVLAGLSILSGVTESGILAVVAQAATSLVSRAHRVEASVAGLHVHTTVGVLLALAGGLALLRIILQVPISIVPARISAELQVRLRNQLFEAFTRASWSEQSRDREGHLQEILTNQVFQAIGGTLQATGLVIAVITFMILVATALALNVGAAVVVVAAAVLLFAILRPLNTMGGRRAERFSQAQMDYASGIGEATRVAEETQVFGVATVQRLRIAKLTDIAQRLSFETQLLGRLIPSIYQSLIYLLLVGGLSVLYASGAGHVASLGAVVLLLVRAGTYGQQMQGAFYYVRQAMPFVERLDDVQRRYAASEPLRGELALEEVKALAFANVSFSYVSGRPVLAGITFEVLGGEAVGIIGPSGAGKSTIVQLLLQLRTPDQGSYLVNGISADRFSPSAWHSKFAYVPQDPQLLHASVADNIRYYRDIDDDEVERAARLACIHDDIAGWSNGYETIVGPRADAVSGGQQQRLCLARALVGRPEVLVLDEPTSALDPRSEALLQQSLLGLKNSVTLFIVAHRMTTLSMCTRVMVIVDGRLEAFDSGALLREKSSYYRSAATITADAAGLALV